MDVFTIICALFFMSPEGLKVNTYEYPSEKFIVNRHENAIAVHSRARNYFIELPASQCTVARVRKKTFLR